MNNDYMVVLCDPQAKDGDVLFEGSIFYYSQHPDGELRRYHWHNFLSFTEFQAKRDNAQMTRIKSYTTLTLTLAEICKAQNIHRADVTYTLIDHYVREKIRALRL